MNTKKINDVDEILPHLHDGQFEEATALWRSIQKTDGHCRISCPFGEEAPTATLCAACLEGNLRTLVLVTTDEGLKGRGYRQAANSVREWLSATVPSSASRSSG